MDNPTSEQEIERMYRIEDYSVERLREIQQNAIKQPEEPKKQQTQVLKRACDKTHDLNITPRKLAAVFGVSDQTIYSWLKGRSTPTGLNLVVLSWLCDALEDEFSNAVLMPVLSGKHKESKGTDEELTRLVLMLVLAAKEQRRQR